MRCTFIFSITLSLLVSLCLSGSSASVLRGLEIGSKAPDFSLKNIEGKEVKFSELAGGKLLVISFWATWSPRSKVLFQELETLNKKLKDNKLEIVGINVNNQNLETTGREQIIDWVKELGISFPVLIDSNLETFHRYGIIAVPSTLIIDGEKSIRFILPSYRKGVLDELTNQVESLLGLRPEEKVVTKTGYKPEGNAHLFYNLGKKLMEQGLTEQAGEKFHEAIRKDPKYANPYNQLGLIQAKMGKWEDALENYRKALEAEEENLPALYNLASVQIKLGQIQGAKAALVKVLTVMPDHSLALYKMGFIAKKEGQLEEAEKYVKAAIEANPHQAEFYYVLGAVYEDNAQKEQALELYRKSLKLLLKE